MGSDEDIRQSPSKPLRPRRLGQSFGPEPSVASRHLPRSGSPPLREEPFARAKPARSPFREVAAKQAGRVQPVDEGIAKSRAGHAWPLRTAVNGLRTRGAREGGSPPLCGWRAVTQSPSRPFQASQARPAPLMGSLLRLPPEIIAAVKTTGVRGNSRISKQSRGRGR